MFQFSSHVPSGKLIFAKGVPTGGPKANKRAPMSSLIFCIRLQREAHFGHYEYANNTYSNMIIYYEFIDFREVPGRAWGGPGDPETRKSTKIYCFLMIS